MYACIHIPRLASCQNSLLGQPKTAFSRASAAKNLVGRVEETPVENRRASALLRALACLFSPYVEFVDEGTAVIPIAPLERLMGGPSVIASEIARRMAERGLLHGNIGIAAEPDTAILTARSIPGTTIIPPGQERRMLGKLPVAVLPVSEESFRVLDHWGIHTLDEFCGLPEAGVLERLGRDGLKLLKIAKGELRRPLKPEAQGIGYTERVETEHPLTLLEPLLFLLSRMLHELCARLRSQSRATAQMRLAMELETRETHTRTLQLPFPTHDPKTLLKLLQLDLETHPPQAAILAASLSVTPVEPRVVQHDLYTPPAPAPERLELTLGKIRAMVGVENAGSPELLDTYRRDAWRMRPMPEMDLGHGGEPGPQVRVAFRYFRPPLRARVDVDEATGRPRRVYAQQVYGAVLECAGPWKASGEWFTGQPWVREEWDLGLNDGGLYRAFAMLERREWFLEGAYD